jgi:hypothetical protein
MLHMDPAGHTLVLRVLGRAMCARTGHWMLGLAWWVCLVGWAPVIHAQESTDAAFTITQMQQWDEAAQAWAAPLALPVSWRSGQARRVRLRAEVDLARAPADLWCLRFERIPPDHDLRLNGQRVHGQPHADGPKRRFGQKALWVDVPPSLLKAGRNTVELDFDLNLNPGGIAPLQIGPARGLVDAHRRAVLFGESLPYSLNMASAGLSLFCLLVWWQRRSEQVLGFFGGLWLLMSLRNMGYYVDGGLLPRALSEGLLFFAQCVSVGLIASFALNVTPLPRWRRQAGVVPYGVLALLMLGVAAALQDQLARARLWVYPLLLLTTAVSFTLLGHAAGGLPRPVRRLVVAGLGLAIVAAVHDYL